MEKQAIFLNPDVCITRNRNKLKIYENNQIFLKNGENFEIMVFNPSQERIGFTISLNNKKISNNLLIINPGERCYLDRFIDENKKFLFETYSVENSDITKNAIENNGNIKLEFFKEQIPQTYGNWWINTGVINTRSPYTGVINTGTPYTGDINWYSTFGTGNVNCTYDSNIGTITTSNSSSDFQMKSLSDDIETGRISKGGESNQTFGTTNFNQNYSSFYTIEFKILPESVKNVNEIKQYCTECGYRIRKSSWKFCPKCGSNI